MIDIGNFLVANDYRSWPIARNGSRPQRRHLPRTGRLRGEQSTPIPDLPIRRRAVGSFRLDQAKGNHRQPRLGPRAAPAHNHSLFVAGARYPHRGPSPGTEVPAIHLGARRWSAPSAQASRACCNAQQAPPLVGGQEPGARVANPSQGISLHGFCQPFGISLRRCAYASIDEITDFRRLIAMQSASMSRIRRSPSSRTQKLTEYGRLASRPGKLAM